jgi:hypothetical protein
MIIRQIHAIGKSRNDFGVASGSSRNTVSLAFKRNHFAAQFSDYLTLNHSVFRERGLYPIRKQEDLTQIVKVRGTKTTVDINILYATTGGVGRFVVKNLAGYSVDEDLWEKVASQIRTEPVFRSIMLQLYLKNHPKFDLWKQKQLYQEEVDQIFKRHNISRITEFLVRWIDNSLLFEHQEG